MTLRARQSGMALLVCLIMLLLLTIIAITAARQSTLQARMAANSQQENVAFQASESGIQAWVASYNATPRIAAISVTTSMSPTVPIVAAAAAPSICAATLEPYSLNASADQFQFACFDIQSNAKSCADSGCADATNPARARHFQGHLVRY